MDPWDDLRFFLAVHRAGSLTAAARTLGCSQPTVGRRIARLARRHGAALMSSQGGGYVLTAAGRRALARAQRIEREVDAIGREIGGLDERPQGSVRVSAPEGFGLTVLAPRLAEFRREYPAIDLVLSGESTVVDLSRREADIAVRFVRPQTHSLIVRRVASFAFAPHASAAYLAARPRDGAALLPTDDVVALHEDLAGWPEMAWLRRHLPDGRVRVRARTPLGVRAAVVAGAGVGLLAPYLVDA